MAKDYAKQISFRAGEISPEFYGDTESDFYEIGLATAENVIINRRGGAFKRKGSNYLYSQAGGEASSPSQKDSGWRIFTHQITKYRFNKIIVSDEALYYELIGEGYEPFNLISNPYFQYGSFTGWSIPFNDWPSSYSLDGYSIHIKGYLDTFGGDSVVVMHTPCTVLRGTGDQHFVQVAQATGSVLTVKIGSSAGADDIASYTSDEEWIDFSFVPNVATYYVALETDANTAPEGNIIYFVGSCAVSDKPASRLQEMSAIGTTLYDRTDLVDVQMIIEPTGAYMLLLHPNYEPIKINNLVGFGYSADSSWATPLTGKPAVWTAQNWPSVGAFHDGRLWLASTPDQPEGLWASHSGDYTDFSLGTGLDAEGLDITMQREGRITWMFSARELLIGCENGEHIVISQGGVITPSDFDIELQSTFGGARIQPVQVGEKIFYVSLDRRKIYTTAYYNEENAWLSVDIAYASEHVTAGLIQRMAWAQNPNNTLHLVMENGDHVTLTYDKAAATLGWCRQPNPNMKVFDLDVGSVNGKDRLVKVAWVTTSERPHVEQETDKDYYLDSFIRFISSTSTTAISGLDHLEGKTVRVVVDGAVAAEQVVSAGAITSNIAGTDFVVGLPYTSKIKTLPPDVDGAQISSWKKRWNKLWALMYESLPPIINGTRPPDRSPSTPMGSPESPSTEAHKVIDLGWDDSGQVTVEEDLPVPMNILSFYGEHNRESL